MLWRKKKECEISTLTTKKEPLSEEYYCDAMKIPKHMLAMTAIFKLNCDSIEQSNNTLFCCLQNVVQLVDMLDASVRNHECFSLCIPLAVVHNAADCTLAQLWMKYTRFSVCLSFYLLRYNFFFHLFNAVCGLSSRFMFRICTMCFGLTFSWVISSDLLNLFYKRERDDRRKKIV